MLTTIKLYGYNAVKMYKNKHKIENSNVEGGGGLHQSWIRLCRVTRRNAKWVSNQVVCETCIYGYRKFLRKLICKENLKCSQRWYKSVWRKSFLYISKCAIFFVSQVSYKSIFMCQCNSNENQVKGLSHFSAWLPYNLLACSVPFSVLFKKKKYLSVLITNNRRGGVEIERSPRMQ